MKRLLRSANNLEDHIQKINKMLVDYNEGKLIPNEGWRGVSHRFRASEMLQRVRPSVTEVCFVRKRCDHGAAEPSTDSPPRWNGFWWLWPSMTPSNLKWNMKDSALRNVLFWDSWNQFVTMLVWLHIDPFPTQYGTRDGRSGDLFSASRWKPQHLDMEKWVF